MSCSVEKQAEDGLRSMTSMEILGLWLPSYVTLVKQGFSFLIEE